MSITGCPGLLTGDVSPLMCTVTAIGGFDRSPRICWKGYKVVCVIHICYLSATTLSHTGYGFPFSYLIVFSLLLAPSFCLAVILALAICFAVRHTQRWRDIGRGTVLKKSIERRKTRMIYSTGFHWHIYTVSGHVLGLLEISTEMSQIHTFMFCSTEMPYS